MSKKPHLPFQQEKAGSTKASSGICIVYVGFRGPEVRYRDDLGENGSDPWQPIGVLAQELTKTAICLRKDLE